jgi:hypothetical protein
MVLRLWYSHRLSNRRDAGLFSNSIGQMSVSFSLPPDIARQYDVDRVRSRSGSESRRNVPVPQATHHAGERPQMCGLILEWAQEKERQVGRSAVGCTEVVGKLEASENADGSHETFDQSVRNRNASPESEGHLIAAGSDGSYDSGVIETGGTRRNARHLMHDLSCILSSQRRYHARRCNQRSHTDLRHHRYRPVASGRLHILEITDGGRSSSTDVRRRREVTSLPADVLHDAASMVRVLRKS